jgi:hypothetical protein
VKYTKNEIEIFKRVIRDYKTIKRDIDKRIKKGYTINDLYDYIRHLNSCNITNVELEDNEIYKYIDFNYCDMCLSIYEQDNIGLYLGETLEVWNDKELYYIGVYNNIREIEEILKESK